MENSMQPTLLKKKKSVDKNLLFCLAVVIIPVIQFIIFYVIVNFNSFLLAFQKVTENYGEKTYSFSLDNFRRLWLDLTETTNLIGALKNTLLTWFLTSIMGSTLAVIFSFYIYKKGWM